MRHCAENIQVMKLQCLMLNLHIRFSYIMTICSFTIVEDTVTAGEHVRVGLLRVTISSDLTLEKQV